MALSVHPSVRPPVGLNLFSFFLFFFFFCVSGAFVVAPSAFACVSETNKRAVTIYSCGYTSDRAVPSPRLLHHARAHLTVR